MTRYDRGVSEVLGFVLIFALVTTMIAIIFTIGFAGLQATQQSEQVNNVERAFDVLDDNLKDLSQRDSFDRGAMSRATELKLASGGELVLDEEITIIIEQNDTVESFSTRPLMYVDDSESKIVYEAGSVIRSDGEFSVMLHEPAHIFRSDRSVLSIIELRQRGEPASIGGGGTVHIVGHHSNIFVAEFDTDSDVNMTIESPRWRAWESYFSEQSIGTVQSDSINETVTYTFPTARSTAIETRIRIQLTR